MSTVVERDPGESELAAAIYPLLHELRPELTEAQLVELLGNGARQGLDVLVAEGEDRSVLGVAIYRLLATSRGRILFLDDLVTTKAARGQGVGGTLIDALRQRARDAGCTRIELDSGVTNYVAHRFYYGLGMRVLAFHFGLEL